MSHHAHHAACDHAYPVISLIFNPFMYGYLEAHREHRGGSAAGGKISLAAGSIINIGNI